LRALYLLTYERVSVRLDVYSNISPRRFEFNRGCEKTAEFEKPGAVSTACCDAPAELTVRLSAALARQQSGRAYSELLRLAGRAQSLTQARVGSDERRRSDRPDVSAHSPGLRTRQLNSLSAAVFHARLLLPCICRFRFGEPTPPVPDERPRLAAEGRSALCPPHPTTKRCLRSDDGRRESTPPSIPAYAEAATPSDSKRIGAAPRRGSASAGEDHPAKVTMLRPVPLAQVVEVRSS
jgi:hypothetical protein